MHFIIYRILVLLFTPALNNSAYKNQQTLHHCAVMLLSAVGRKSYHCYVYTRFSWTCKLEFRNENKHIKRIMLKFKVYFHYKVGTN